MRDTTHLAKYFRVTENDNTIFRACESDIQTPGVVQKPNSLVFVAPDTAKDDVVFLATLECIHGSHLNLLVKILLQRTIVLHIGDDVRTLSFVWRHNTNLSGYNTRLEEFRDDFLDVRCFSPENASSWQEGTERKRAHLFRNDVPLLDISS